MNRMIKATSIAALLAVIPTAWAVQSGSQTEQRPNVQFHESAPASTPEMDAKMADTAAQLAFEIASELEPPPQQQREPQKTCHAHKAGGHAQHGEHSAGGCQKGCNQLASHDGKTTVLQGHCPKSKI